MNIKVTKEKFIQTLFFHEPRSQTWPRGLWSINLMTVRLGSGLLQTDPLHFKIQGVEKITWHFFQSIQYEFVKRVLLFIFFILLLLDTLVRMSITLAHFLEANNESSLLPLRGMQVCVIWFDVPMWAFGVINTFDFFFLYQTGTVLQNSFDSSWPSTDELAANYQYCSCDWYCIDSHWYSLHISQPSLQSIFAPSWW